MTSLRPLSLRPLRRPQVMALPEEVESLPSMASADKFDRSEAWIRHMLLPEVPELPRNRAALTDLLFPLEEHQKLPVTKQFYTRLSSSMPLLTAEHLVRADGSMLPAAVATFFSALIWPSVTETQTSLLVASCFNLFFNIFNEYIRPSKAALAFSTENSQTTEPRSRRPDTVVIDRGSGCTFLVGEEKVGDLYAAEADLMSKMKPLNRMFYGEVKFILGYYAADKKFQWVYIGMNGSKDLHLIGPCLNLSNIRDCCKFLLSLGYAFQLLTKMAESVPDVPGRRPMFSVEESSDKKRIIWFHARGVVKHIRGFNSHIADQETSFSEIQRAYAVAKGCPFLLQATKGPTVSAHGTYKVECEPLGYSCRLRSEQDGRWMARCVCQALCILHNAGLVHRDIRFPNIVRLSETAFVLIDLESVANSPFTVHEDFRHFSAWRPEMLEGNQYTPFSDMYSLGELLDAALYGESTALAEFVRKLTNKQLSASDALQDPWLAELMP